MKSSLAPGSKVVTEYYDKAGLTPYLEELGFHTVGYGCTTCIGNSGPLPDEISRGCRAGRPRRLRRALGQPQLRGPHPPRGEGELPRVTSARRGVRARGADGHRPRDRADRDRLGRRGRLPLGPLALARGGAGDRRGSHRRGDVPDDVRRRVHRRRDLALAPGPGGRALRLGTGLDVRPAADRTSTACRSSRARSTTSRARAASSRSATPSRPTTSRPRARSSRTRRPAATSSSTASSGRTSTRTDRAAATTR